MYVCMYVGRFQMWLDDDEPVRRDVMLDVALWVLVVEGIFGPISCDFKPGKAIIGFFVLHEMVNFISA